MPPGHRAHAILFAGWLESATGAQWQCSGAARNHAGLRSHSWRWLQRLDGTVETVEVDQVVAAEAILEAGEAAQARVIVDRGDDPGLASPSDRNTDADRKTDAGEGLRRRRQRGGGDGVHDSISRRQRVQTTSLTTAPSSWPQKTQ